MHTPPTHPADATRVRSHNSAMVLRRLWTAGELSRADISRQTGLSRSTVSAIVAELLETAPIREVRAGVSRGGRRPILLGFDYEAAQVIGVDVGATHVAVACTDLKGEVRVYKEAPCAVRAEPETTLELIGTLIADAISDDQGLLAGIGVAVPSPVDARRPGRASSLVMPEWADIAIDRVLQDAFEVPVLVDNDANLGALAELSWGQHGSATSLVYIKAGTGVGAGLIADGRIFRGARGIAGEIGHTPVDPQGPPCICGLDGCLNTVAGSVQLLESYRAEAARTGKGQPDLESISDLVRAARAGDASARSIIEAAGRSIGTSVATLLNIFNPEVVVVGGGIVEAGPQLLTPLRETVSNRSLSEAIAHAAIVPSTLGARCIAIGAATLLIEAALNDPTLLARSKVIGADERA